MRADLCIDETPVRLPDEDPSRSSGKQDERSFNLLAYVHLRNIHGCTGAGRVARQLTEQLAADPCVRLRILADRDDATRIVPLAGEPWTSFHYDTFAKDTSRQQLQWYWTGSPRAESFWSDVEIVYCTTESYVPTRKARLVVTAHDAAYFENDAHRRDLAFLRQRLKWRLLFHRLVARADLIHTVSHFSAERLAHFFPALSSRIRVVHNAVTSCFFGPVSQQGFQCMEDYGLNGRPFVLIPGGLHYRKNADLILTVAPRLLARFPDLIIVVAGHNTPHYAERTHSFGPRVLLTGFVRDETLHALYAAAGAVWFPSLYEGFGLPVLEAMASGAAVVASAASSIPEIAGSAALLADPADSVGHIERLALLLEEESVRSEYSRRGRVHARSFTWRRSAANLKRCFEQLL
jgi:glycosyltransferase involved in cell wall biosynthesis